MLRLTLLCFVLFLVSPVFARFYDELTGRSVKGCPPGTVGFMDFGFRVHFECSDDEKQVVIGCTINGNLYEPDEEVTIDSIRSRMCVEKPHQFIRNEILGCETDDGKLLTHTITLQQEDGSSFGCYIRRNRSGRILKAKWYRKARRMV